MAPVISYEQWREQQALDPQFIAEVEKLEPSYQIARLRMRLGLTQAQLAEMVGTKQPSIARLEKGEGSPSLSFLAKVAEALGAEIRVSLIPRSSAASMHEESPGYRTPGS